MKKIIKYIILTIFGGVLFHSCNNIEDKYMYNSDSYTIDWNAAADSATTSLVSRFWNTTGHYFVYTPDNWSDTNPGYWPQAHAMDVVIDAYIRTKDTKYSLLFDQWYDGIKTVNFSTHQDYWNAYYDDMSWICLTMIRLYDVTKTDKYLTTAKELWGYIKSGWDETYANGGISWEYYDHKWSKNACTNGPASIIGSRMYAITKDESDKEWASKIYEWEKATLYNPATGAVYDNINGQTNELSKTTLSYNQGTFLGAAYELYKITGDITYLNDARKAAYYAISNSSMIDTGNNVLRDEGDGDGGLFKGIFMRYFVQLMLENNLDIVYKNKFETFFNNNAETLWRKGVLKQDILFGTSWTTPAVGTTQLTSHVSGCTLIEAKAYYQKNKK